MRDDVAAALRAFKGDSSCEPPRCFGFSDLFGGRSGGSLPVLLAALGSLLSLLGLRRIGRRLCRNKMEERLLEHLTCGDEWMRSVSGEFDVSVEDTAVGSAHANVAANPSREEQEFPIEQVPFRSPRQRDVIHPEGLHFGGQPSENADDENHGEHHGLHGTHLDIHLFGHHLLLKGHGLFLQNWVARKASFVHDLPNLSLTVTDVGLVHRVDEKIANDGVQGH